jgi:hypothetical protein
MHAFFRLVGTKPGLGNKLFDLNGHGKCPLVTSGIAT